MVAIKLLIEQRFIINYVTVEEYSQDQVYCSTMQKISSIQSPPQKHRRSLCVLVYLLAGRDHSIFVQLLLLVLLIFHSPCRKIMMNVANSWFTNSLIFIFQKVWLNSVIRKTINIDFKAPDHMLKTSHKVLYIHKIIFRNALTILNFFLIHHPLTEVKWIIR